MTVITFQPRFAALVAARTKGHTIRGPRKRAIRVGDRLSLRQWTGLPYRSPQRLLFDTYCTRIADIVIGYRHDGAADAISIDGVRLDTAGRARLSRDDGFACTTDLLAWFESTYGLPFTGVLICWNPHP